MTGGILMLASREDGFDRAADLLPVLEHRGMAVRVLACEDLGVARLHRHLRESKPAVLHCFGEAALPLGCAAALGTGVAVVASLNRPLQGIAARVAVRAAARVVLPCHDLAGRYIRARISAQDRTLALPDPVDPEVFRPEVRAREEARRRLGWERKFLWLYAGAARRQDLDLLFRAFSFRNARPGAGLAVAGGGSGAPDGVSFENDTDVSELMRAADAFVSPERMFAPSPELIRAACSALPIAATMSGGNSELVMDGWSGFLAPPDSPEALGGVMDRVESMSSAERMRMGGAGRAYAEAVHAASHIAARWERLYRETARAEAAEVPVRAETPPN